MVLDYPSWAVDAIVAIAAFPLTVAVLWLLLRSQASERLVAVPSDERWHERATRPSGASASSRASSAASSCARRRRRRVERRARRDPRRCHVVFAAGLVDDLRRLSPIAKLAAQIGAAVIVLASGLNVEIVGNDVLAWAIGLLWLVGITNAFNLLDNMDGLAATLAVVSCAYFAIDAFTEHDNKTVLVLALALGLACAGFLPFNLRPRRGAVVFMGDSGSQVLGFGLASLALAASWTVAGTTVATICSPARARDPDPRYDAGDDRAAHGAKAGHARRPGSHVASARLLRPLGDEGRAPARARVVGDRGDGARLQRARQRPPDRGRRAGDVRPARPVRSFLSDLEERSRRGVEGPEPSLWRALVFEPRRLLEVVVDFILICASFLAAYALAVGGTGTEFERSVYLSALPILLAPVRLLRRARRLSQGLALRDRSRRRADRRCVRRLLGRRVSRPDRTPGPRVVPGRRDLLRRRRALHRSSSAGRAWRCGSYRKRAVVESTAAACSSRAPAEPDEGLARELREGHEARVVGFLDDNPRVRRRRILGITVVGSLDEAPRAIASSRAEEVLVTIPEAPQERLDAVVHASEAAGIPCRIVKRHVEFSTPEPVEAARS